MGDSGNKLYIIKEGEVDVMVGNKQIDHLTQGNFFGERALMDDKPRMATVVASTNLVVGTLSKSFFVTTIKPLPQPQQLIRRRRSSEDTRDASSLTTIAQVGKGAYGLVFLVEHDQTREKFALKAQKKIASRRDNMFQERNLMADMMPHPCVCCMFNTYQDAEWVYMLIEYLPGGDLFDVQDDMGGSFSEEHARFYIAGVVLALEHMHKQHVIYRDLKPENVLVDEAGYIKVVDLGLAKRLMVGTKTFTQCGTPCYFSPEIIQHLAYDFAVDWWCCGVLLFELLTGRTPFETADHNVQAMYVKILKNEIVFPDSFSAHAQSLIAALLHPKAAKRLGNLQNDADDVKMHPFFLGFDWDGLYDKKVRRAPERRRRRARGRSPRAPAVPRPPSSRRPSSQARRRCLPVGVVRKIRSVRTRPTTRATGRGGDPLPSERSHGPRPLRPRRAAPAWPRPRPGRGVGPPGTIPRGAWPRRLPAECQLLVGNGEAPFMCIPRWPPCRGEP